MRVWIATFVLVASIGCQSQKQADRDIEQANQDYQVALNAFKLGCNYLNDAQYVQAIKSLKEAISLEDHNFRYHHWLGLAYMLNGQLTEAKSQFSIAIDINPESVDSRNNLAIIAIDEGDFDAAYEQLKIVIRSSDYGQPQLAYFNLGLCLAHQEKTREAVAAFVQATKIDPEFYRAYLHVAELYAADANHKMALEYYLKAEKGYANEVEVLYKIGKSYFQLHDWENAQKYLTQVSILFPPPEIDSPTQNMLSVIEKKL